MNGLVMAATWCTADSSAVGSLQPVPRNTSPTAEPRISGLVATILMSLPAGSLAPERRQGDDRQYVEQRHDDGRQHGHRPHVRPGTSTVASGRPIMARLLRYIPCIFTPCFS